MSFVLLTLSTIRKKNGAKDYEDKGFEEPNRALRELCKITFAHILSLRDMGGGGSFFLSLECSKMSKCFSFKISIF